MSPSHSGLDSIFPVTDKDLPGQPTFGLTKRELFAAMVLQGFAADPNTDEGVPKNIAACAVMWADALITALEMD